MWCTLFNFYEAYGGSVPVPHVIFQIYSTIIIMFHQIRWPINNSQTPSRRLRFQASPPLLLVSSILSVWLIQNHDWAKPFLFQMQMIIFHNVTITVPDNFTQCTTHGSFVQHWQETLYNMFTFVCLFLLPLVIMIFCYTRILIEISSRMARGNCKFHILFPICSRNVLAERVVRDRKCCYPLFQCSQEMFISAAPTTTSRKLGWGPLRWASLSWRRSSCAGHLTTC